MTSVQQFYKYRLASFWRVTALYYVIVIALWGLTLIFNDSFHFNGSTFGFLFIFGLNIFKTDFLFAQANNISRRSFLLASVFAIFTLAFTVGLIDHLLSLLIKSPSRYVGLLYSVYPASFTRFIAQTVLYFSATLMGLLVSMVYYRVSTLFKVLISFSPLTIIVLFNVINSRVGGGLSQIISLSFSKLFGLSGTLPNPNPALLSLAFFSLILLASNSLLMLKMPVKAP